MLKQKRRTKRINPEKWYSLNEIVEGRLLANLRGWKSVRRVVNADKKHKNLLGTVITGTGRGTKYRVKGENLKRFKEEWESGKYRLLEEEL